MRRSSNRLCPRSIPPSIVSASAGDLSDNVPSITRFLNVPVASMPTLGSDKRPTSLPTSNCGCNVPDRSEEHTSELQSLMRISYAVFCLKKKKHNKTHTTTQTKYTIN